MNVSNNADSLLRQNPALTVGNHTWQERMQGRKNKRNNPLDDALHRLSDNVLGAREQRAGRQTAAHKREIERDAFISELGGAENKSFEGMDSGLLKFLMNQFTNGARAAQAYESVLTDFRDQLSAFDKTIRDYRSMLDGKTALPEQMTTETVARLLEAAENAREQFKNDGIKSMEDSRWIGSADSVYGHAKLFRGVSGEYADKDESFWCVDASADDIYGEIDRVLGAVRDLGQRFESGASTAAKELEKRGYAEDKYQEHFDKLRAFWSDVYAEWRADPNVTMRQYMEDALAKADED